MKIADYPHYFHISNYEEGILIGRCQKDGCEAIKYFPCDPFDPEAVKWVNQLNKGLGYKMSKASHYSHQIHKDRITKKKEKPKMTETIKVKQPAPLEATFPVIRAKRLTYLEQNKEAILNDSRSMKIKDFLAKWHISPSTWQKFKILWKIKSNKNRYGNRERLNTIRELRGKKCQVCQYAYEHDRQKWCSMKVCPSRLPSANRFAYRPKKNPKSPSDTEVDHNSWPEVTQVKWLETYREMAVKGGE